ncbi:MAG: DUF1801 domain-containing protein [Chitinophagaceae bacterium]|nr:MAG: DUF1801 domain-containing protein [Chitinophagaceae bacterium]
MDLGKNVINQQAGMAKKIMTDSEKVAAHLQQLPAEQFAVVQLLRSAILETDKSVAEHIKWNSPAFYYCGEIKAFDAKEYKRDIVVLNLHRGKILLVFPTGARVNDQPLLEGTYTDGRRTIAIADREDAEIKLKGIQAVIRSWLRGVEK